MAAHGGKFCTSVSVLFSVLYVSSSPLHDFNFHFLTFCLVRHRKHSQPWKNCTDEILLDQFYIFECLKRFVIAVWPKNCPKLSKDGKLTVKKDIHLVVSPSNFSGSFYQVSCQFETLCNETLVIINYFDDQLVPFLLVQQCRY